MKCDADQARKLYQLAAACGLEGVMYPASLTFAEMAAAYNGCGPEWAPARVREILDRIFSEFEPCFFLHDIMWAVSDGTDEYFRWSNECLLNNCRKIADAKHPWWSPLRYVRRRQAKLIHAACRDFGKIAYNQAYYDSATRPKGGAE